MTAEPLATSTDLAAWLAGDDGTAIAAAQDTVRGHCGWHVAPVVEQTVELDSQPEVGSLWLPTLRLVAVSEVTLTAADPSDELTLTEGIDYSVSRVLGAIVGAVTYRWPRGFAAVRVVFTHGHEEVPPVVKAITTRLAAAFQAAPSGAPSETVGPFSEQHGPAALTADEKAMLSPYRIENPP